MLKVKDFKKSQVIISKKNIVVYNNHKVLFICKYDNQFLVGQYDYEIIKNFTKYNGNYIRIQTIKGIDFDNQHIYCNIMLLSE